MQLGPFDALKTYRYLRIGIVCAVVLLAASIGIEAVKAGCLQTSISAYYYTPVRAIFVGSLFAIGLALIVFKGRGSRDDFLLNLAGMLAPVVAVAPTTDVGRCYSFPPNPLPLEGDSLAQWVVTNIDNNFRALLIVGGVGLGVAIITWFVTRNDPQRAAENQRGTVAAMAGTAVVLLLAWWLLERWDDFYTLAHGYAAALMFAFLAAAILSNAWEERNTRRRVLTRTYVAIGLLMIAGVVFPALRLFDEHVVFALEAYEITWFAVYWLIQTVENWDEEVAAP
ncbi:MAG: hypothetical protein M3N24_00895 [Actinomycetota bacterium]|nr:hypothetical protein [Actinomycetota bacterium]